MAETGGKVRYSRGEKREGLKGNSEERSRGLEGMLNTKTVRSEAVVEETNQTLK